MEFPRGVCVIKRSFYHVNRRLKYNPHGSLIVGSRFSVGSEFNPFYSYMIAPQSIPMNRPGLPTAPSGQKYLELLKDGLIRRPDALSVAYAISDYHWSIARELILEQVRELHFRDAPSRQRALWVTDNYESAALWARKLGGGGQILTVNLSGSLHRVDAGNLPRAGEGLEANFESARTYWSGAPSTEREFEHLFVGEVEVVATKALPLPSE
jgi:hypothetical protein